MDFEIASVGGKDSMSGSFENIDVPPTLVSFAVAHGKTGDVITSEFKGSGHKTVLIAPVYLSGLGQCGGFYNSVDAAVSRV